jgi:hypothetical protein
VLLVIAVWSLRKGAQSGICGLLAYGLLLGAMLWFQRRFIGEIIETAREGSAWLKGAHGERLVSQALQNLPDEYVVFNDFHPVDRVTGEPASWNIDHVVVGPTGVFVIDAKYYRHAFVPSAERNPFSKHNVRQAQRTARDLKTALVRWSAGDLENLFVVPIVAYAQPDARTERLREGSVRTVPLRLLVKEIMGHAETAIDLDKAGRIARVLFGQIAPDLQYKFKAEFDAYGEVSKAARQAARDQRLARQSAQTANSAPEEAPPEVCPRCGGRLVRRVARYGDRAGKPFLGCENYRKTGCRYGFNLES